MKRSFPRIHLAAFGILLAGFGILVPGVGILVPAFGAHADFQQANYSEVRPAKTWTTEAPAFMAATWLGKISGSSSYAAAQSGRRVVRPTTQPAPPVQAPVFSNPDPNPKPEPVVEVALRSLPDNLRQRSLKSFDDSTFRLSDFKNKIIVLNMWASWCRPCRTEVPEYEKVRKEYAGRNVEFIGLTAEDPRTRLKHVQKFVRELNFGFRLGWADEGTARTLMRGYEGIPQTLVIAPDGRVLSHWDGFSRVHSGDALRAAIEQAFEEYAEVGG